MTCNKTNKLSWKILTSFALLTAIVLELVGSFVPEIIRTRQNATSEGDSNVEYDISYSLWTRKICYIHLTCDNSGQCQEVGISNGKPIKAFPVCETSVYFPADSDEIADVLVWGKKIQMPSVFLGFVGFILYEYNVFMFVDCPFKNRKTVKRFASIFSVIAGAGSWICVTIFTSWTLQTSERYQLGWALSFPIIGGLLQLVFICVGWFCDKNSDKETYIDAPDAPVEKVRTPRKIRFEDEPSIRSDTELLPFDII